MGCPLGFSHHTGKTPIANESHGDRTQNWNNPCLGNTDKSLRKKNASKRRVRTANEKTSCRKQRYKHKEERSFGHDLIGHDPGNWLGNESNKTAKSQNLSHCHSFPVLGQEQIDGQKGHDTGLNVPDKKIGGKKRAPSRKIPAKKTPLCQIKKRGKNHWTRER